MFDKAIKVILWDFDGVILDSMTVRDWGFREIFKNFKSDLVEELINYHRANGGLSRYVKIRYFYEVLLGQSITEQEVLRYAQEFSILMKQKLTSPNNLINDTVNFIKKNHTKFNFHIVSGSDQEELRFLCKELFLEKYFLSIEGSPTPKKKLVENILKEYSYKNCDCCLIGDSINDYEAANQNRISFYGFNNKQLLDFSENYIKSFSDFN